MEGDLGESQRTYQHAKVNGGVAEITSFPAPLRSRVALQAGHLSLGVAMLQIASFTSMTNREGVIVGGPGEERVLARYTRQCLMCTAVWSTRCLSSAPTQAHTNTLVEVYGLKD